MKPWTMEVTEECEFREPGIGRMFPTHRGWRPNAKKMRISCKSMELTGCRVYLSGRVFAYPAGYPQKEEVGVTYNQTAVQAGARGP